MLKIYFMDFLTNIRCICAAFEALGIDSKKKAHAARNAGVQGNQEANVPRDGIRHTTHHNAKDVLDNCYGHKLPRGTMRATAGFRHDRQEFFLPRNVLKPPGSLSCKVFPQLDELRAHHHNPNVSSMICTKGFIDMLYHLRDVILQDAVFLMLEEEVDIGNGKTFSYKDHQLFKDEIFTSPEFLEYAADLREAAAATKNPADSSMENVLPVLNDKLDLQHSDLLGSLSEIKLQMERLVKQESNSLRQHFDHAINNLENKLLGAQNSHSQNTSALSARPSSSQSEFQSADNVVHKVPTYRLSRGISTVPQLWEEWNEGINGSMSVAKFFELHGRKGLPDDSERKFARRRQRIITKVKNISSSTGCDIESAIDSIEAFRLQRGYSIHKLAEKINELDN